MLIPLVILAVLAAVAGFANINDGFGELVEGWLPTETEELVTHGGFQLWIAVASRAVGAGRVGRGVAGLRSCGSSSSDRVRHIAEPLPEILENKYYLDALYEDVLRQASLARRHGMGARAVGQVRHRWRRERRGERRAMWGAEQVRLAQAGQAQLYASAMLIGVVGAIAGILIVNPP